MFDEPLISISDKERLTVATGIAEVVATAGLVLILFTAVQRPTALTAAIVAVYIGGAYLFTSSTSFANPALTLARVLTDTFAGIAPSSAVGFIGAQFLGALCGLGIIVIYRRSNRSPGLFAELVPRSEPERTRGERVATRGHGAPLRLANLEGRRKAALVEESRLQGVGDVASEAVGRPSGTEDEQVEQFRRAERPHHIGRFGHGDADRSCPRSASVSALWCMRSRRLLSLSRKSAAISGSASGRIPNEEVDRRDQRRDLGGQRAPTADDRVRIRFAVLQLVGAQRRGGRAAAQEALFVDRPDQPALAAEGLVDGVDRQLGVIGDRRDRGGGSTRRRESGRALNGGSPRGCGAPAPDARASRRAGASIPWT